MNKSSWVCLEGDWHHRPLWKVMINSALRFLQHGKRYQWLIATRVLAADQRAEPEAIGYCLARVEMRNAP